MNIVRRGTFMQKTFHSKRSSEKWWTCASSVTIYGFAYNIRQLFLQCQEEVSCSWTTSNNNLLKDMYADFIKEYIEHGCSHFMEKRTLWAITVVSTVTYGVASAPFPAMRSLFHIADVKKDAFSLASSATRESFYVDDLLTGAESTDHLQKLKKFFVLMVFLLLNGTRILHDYLTHLIMKS